MQNVPRCAVVPASFPTFSPQLTSGLNRYIPPNEGKVRIRVIEGYSLSLATEENGSGTSTNASASVQPYPLSHNKARLIIHTAEQSSDPIELIILAIESYRLYLEEAQKLF